jgi:hypothetical protein
MNYMFRVSEKTKNEIQEEVTRIGTISRSKLIRYFIEDYIKETNIKSMTPALNGGNVIKIQIYIGFEAKSRIMSVLRRGKNKNLSSFDLIENAWGLYKEKRKITRIVYNLLGKE